MQLTQRPYIHIKEYAQRSTLLFIFIIPGYYTSPILSVSGSGNLPLLLSEGRDHMAKSLDLKIQTIHTH